VELPPEELASLGSKKLCDPDSLKVFSALKARAVTLLSNIGVRFLGGWAIPDEETQLVCDKLKELKNDFLAAKDAFLSNYDEAVQFWVAKHPGWERLIADSKVSVDQVRHRFSFNWQFYKVIPPDQEVAGESLKAEVDSLGQSLFGEIAKEAGVVWNIIFAGKIEVSHKALSPLKAMRQKLLGLSFVGTEVAPIADPIGTALSIVPKRGLISGENLLTIQGLVSLLRDPDLLLENGRKILEGLSASGLLSTFGSNPSQNPLETLLEDDEPEEEDFLADPSEKPSLAEEFSSEETLAQVDETAGPNGRPDEQSRLVPVLDSLGLW
jgi:hypothetical protein